MTEVKLMIASVSVIPVKVIKALQTGYQIPDPLPWAQLAGRLAAAEDSLARLDERLAKSPIRDGFVARTHFHDACASLWLDGELVHLEDLVLHDAGMDVRAPTFELTRAHAVLRARRRIAADPTEALSVNGLAALRGRGANQERSDREGREPTGRGDTDDRADDADCDVEDRTDDEDDGFAADARPAQNPDPRFADAYAAIDAAVVRTDHLLAAGAARKTLDRNPGTEVVSRPERDPLIYDSDWDEEERLQTWRGVIAQTAQWPPVLAAAIAYDAWEVLEPLQRNPWLGRLLVAAILGARGKTRAHLMCLNVGLRTVPREIRRARDRTTRLTAVLDAARAAAEAGLKEHNNLLLAHDQLLRKLSGRRATSHLPALIDLVLARPIASAAMIAQKLGITPRAAQNLVVELGLREMTGRGRYRAWGV